MKDYLVSYFKFLYSFDVHDKRCNYPTLFSEVVQAESKRDAYEKVMDRLFLGDRDNGIIAITLLDD